MFLSIKLRIPPRKEGGISWIDESTDEYFVAHCAFGTIRLRKRMVYPKTFLSIKGSRLIFGYGELPASLEKYGTIKEDEYYRKEFLLGLVDVEAQTLRLHRDAFCTLPLFIQTGKTSLAIGDDMHDVAGGNLLTLNQTALADLLFRPEINSQTLSSEVTLLSERASLLWQNGVSNVTRPTYLPVQVKSDPLEFKKQLETILETYWQKVEGANIAFEVSGGIDSATMPLFISTKYKSEVVLGNMEFLDNFGETQRQKLRDLMAIMGGKIISCLINEKDHYPLARFFKNGLKPRLHYQYQEIYSEALAELAMKLKKENVDVVYTGIGGDELFENVVADMLKYKVSPMGFYKSKPAKNLIRQLSEPASDFTLIANSALYAGQSRNKIYIDHNIWPVAPLSDPLLYQFTQGLGITYRANKNILRAYHEASGSPSSIYHPVQNEHFGRFFEDSIKQAFPTILPKLGQHSALEDLGLVDWATLLEAFDEARWHENRHQALFDIFRLADAEVILQATKFNFPVVF